MLIKEIGGEFALLERVLKQASETRRFEQVVPNGDDCAVLRIADKLISITTDSIIEGVHFNFNYFSVEQVGKKAIETSASDVLAMGGRPLYVLVGVALPEDFSVEDSQRLFNGMYGACERISVSIIGGDTSRSPGGVCINVTVLGEIESRARIFKRSDAKPGEQLYVSGCLGLSAAGLLLLQKKIPGFETLKRKHLEPECRFDLLDRLPTKIGAMIDISDGLASELEHISKSSGCKIIIDEGALEIDSELGVVCKLLNENAYELIYSGGEDYELLYTVAPNTGNCPGYRIGEILEGRGVFVRRGTKFEPLSSKGYVHFKI